MASICRLPFIYAYMHIQSKYPCKTPIMAMSWTCLRFRQQLPAIYAIYTSIPQRNGCSIYRAVLTLPQHPIILSNNGHARHRMPLDKSYG